MVEFAVCIALFLLISLVSFSPQDPGWTHSSDSGMVSNLGGRAGANFANLFLNLFGLMAYLFPIMLLWLVVRIYRQKSASHAKDIHTRIVVSVGFVLTMIGGCGLAQMYFSSRINRFISATSSVVRSNHDATCRHGKISLCPGVTGKVSSTAAARRFSRMIVPGLISQRKQMLS